MNFKENIQERFLFLFKFFCYPKQIGSIAPSSKYLAKKMIESVKWNEINSAAELGAGTGAITRYIQEITSGQAIKVLLFEKDDYMRNALEKQYPEYSCYTDCRELLNSLKSEKIDQLDCIISGLPFFNFPQNLRDIFIEQIQLSLKEKGVFIAFQYSTQMKKQLGEWFEIEAIKFVPLNVPPAFIYVCRKKGGMVQR